jgi:hypothetical protein
MHTRALNLKPSMGRLVKHFMPLALAITTCVASATDIPTKPASTTAAAKSGAWELPNGSSHDFDFFSGRNWTVHGRKRVGRFKGSNQWEEMDGYETTRRIGDKGMIVELFFPTWRPGFKITVLRLWDPSTRTWEEIDIRPDAISPPLVGAFHNGLGILVGDDKIDGKDVKTRYTWTADPVHPRYQQEFSDDGGRTWEIDWQMEFTEAKS